MMPKNMMPKNMMSQNTVTKNMKPLLLGSMLLASQAQAIPFDSCPAQAYLFQGNPVEVYSVDLATGSFTLLEDNPGVPEINAAGFSGDYIYGYDNSYLNVVRLGQDLQATPVDVTGLPLSIFYAGDVKDDIYYLYQQWNGFYKIDLTPLDSDSNATLSADLIIQIPTLEITDFAFHPNNGKLYGIDNNTGWLYELDTTTGAENYIGDTGKTGIFGAFYFDSDGKAYVVRNEDGQIYRIDLSTQAIIDSGIVPAVAFSDGQPTSRNDGARCATASLTDPTTPATTDFGDAPDSYATTLASNGARHEMDGVTWLGSSVDAEHTAAQSPQSDDSVGSDDEDGVNFVTALEPGLDSVLSVTASTTGYLSAWFDWNNDGDFDDEGEQIITDASLSAGSNSLSIDVPGNATVGNIWSRFRFSQQSGLDYSGGSTSGEVEDYSVNISNTTTVTYLPSASNYVTLAYEDEWPRTADYDMNDMVLNYRVMEVSKDGLVEKITISGKLVAIGATYHNGFAVRLEGIDSDLIDTEKTRLYYNNVLQSIDPQESDMDEASFIIINDAIEIADYQCDFFRTADDCREDVGLEFELDVSFSTPINPADMPAMPYDPLMFATPGYYHGPSFTQPPGRGYEVHLADKAPTEKFNTDFYQLEDDTSNPSESRYFKTSNNMPWALMIYNEWQWPRERVNLTEAYPKFADYTTSGGTTDTDWHNIDNAISGKYY